MNRPWGDNLHTRTLSAALACLAAVALVGCDPASTSKQPTTPSPTATAEASDTARPAKDDKPGERKKEVANFVGMGLQSAQDKAQADGFYRLRSHDSAGRDRMQALDRHWKVCFQNYAPGKSIPVDTELDFGAVKLEENCPAKDQKEPEVEGGRMPNLAGKSVKAARGALDSSTSITVTDATGDRMVLLESNWQVCTQNPAPGVALTGQPVEFTAVKYDETCP
ncbi:hypothetical protein [Streptomyces sp. NBC_01217]|uniref:hypothetical protein n=1 Tax=Streptomyces sp. NBC_01217 TaxID=2903779 RepID=UPI002E13C343|nr:hypothetical protein OG507_06155 [Streptomyces sp. NBC_01217]